METERPNETPRRPWLLALGLLFTALGTVGAVLPLVPTTPFLLLAVACFSRSSPRWHARLLESRMFGPYLRQWQHDHTVPPAAKRRAYVLVVLTFGISIALADKLGLRVFLIALGISLLGFLAWLPATRPEDPAER